MARVLIADDSPTSVAGLRETVEADGLEVVGTCTTSDEAVARAAEDAPDVVLLGLDMEELPHAIDVLRTRAPGCEVVLFGDSRGTEALLGLVAAGASGILLGATDPERIGAAVRGVLAGETAFPRALVRAMADRIAGRTADRAKLRAHQPALTDRECDVMAGLARGDTAVALSGSLGIAPATVRRHCANAVRKLGAPDREAALRLIAT